MLETHTATQPIVLMGGPCSGQTRLVVADSTSVTVHDAAGGVHEYVCTGLTVDADDGPPWTVFRRAATG